MSACEWRSLLLNQADVQDTAAWYHWAGAGHRHEQTLRTASAPQAFLADSHSVLHRTGFSFSVLFIHQIHVHYAVERGHAVIMLSWEATLRLAVCLFICLSVCLSVCHIQASNSFAMIGVTIAMLFWGQFKVTRSCQA